jgi:acyl-CoA dehydrogenase
MKNPQEREAHLDITDQANVTGGLNLSLSDEQRALVETVRRFVRERIWPAEAELDPDASDLPPQTAERLIAETKAMGLHNMDVPAEHGGPGIDTVTRALLAMETSQHRAGLYAPCYGAFGTSGLAQLYDANEDQKERYLYPSLRGERRGFFALTEPAGGSDPARAIETKAVQKGHTWILNGTKVFISAADRADFGLVFARTGGPGSGRDGITCFIVDRDTPGFYVRRVIHTLRSGHYPTELQFDDAEVPAANVLGEIGGGFRLANKRLSQNRIPYAAGCVGVAMRAHEMALEYVKYRKVFGQTLAEHEGIQWMLVDNEMDIRAAALLTLHAASLADQEKPFRTESAIAKITASEAGSRVVDRSLQIHGGYGVTKELPLERWYREMRIRRIGEGTTETQRMIISRDLLRGGTHFL